MKATEIFKIICCKRQTFQKNFELFCFYKTSFSCSICDAVKISRYLGLLPESKLFQSVLLNSADIKQFFDSVPAFPNKNATLHRKARISKLKESA